MAEDATPTSEPLNIAISNDDAPESLLMALGPQVLDELRKMLANVLLTGAPTVRKRVNTKPRSCDCSIEQAT